MSNIKARYILLPLIASPVTVFRAVVRHFKGPFVKVAGQDVHVFDRIAQLESDLADAQRNVRVTTHVFNKMSIERMHHLNVLYELQEIVSENGLDLDNPELLNIDHFTKDLSPRGRYRGKKND